MKNIKNSFVKTKIFFTVLATGFCLDASAATAQSYGQCLSTVSSSQNNSDFSAEDFKESNNYVERFLGVILSSLPKTLEAEIVRLAGVNTKEIQALRNHVAENGAIFDEATEQTMNEKLKIAHTTYYSYHPYDDRFIVLFTPEGKVFHAYVSEKGVLSEKLTRKFTIKDDVRNYYFSVHHDVKCKKNCDNYIWMVDSAPVANPATAVIKPKDFPVLAATEIKGSKANDLSRAILEEEVKYGVAMLVGVEKAQKLKGRVVLPDPQDTSKYNREKFVNALKVCERSLASSTKDKELLVQAIALLR